MWRLLSSLLVITVFGISSLSHSSEKKHREVSDILKCDLSPSWTFVETFKYVARGYPNQPAPVFQYKLSDVATNGQCRNELAILAGNSKLTDPDFSNYRCEVTTLPSPSYTESQVQPVVPGDDGIRGGPGPNTFTISMFHKTSVTPEELQKETCKKLSVCFISEQDSHQIDLETAKAKALSCW